MLAAAGRSKQRATKMTTAAVQSTPDTLTPVAMTIALPALKKDEIQVGVSVLPFSRIGERLFHCCRDQ